MMTRSEIIEALCGLNYEESSSVLEELLSVHLRGRVYTADIKRHLEDGIFQAQYYRYLSDDRENPVPVLEKFLELEKLEKLEKLLLEKEGR